MSDEPLILSRVATPNTVHFSDKAMEMLTHHSIILGRNWDGALSCRIGDFLVVADSLQSALDNAIALIDEKNERYSKNTA